MCNQVILRKREIKSVCVQSSGVNPIINFTRNSLDKHGQPLETYFKRFIQSNKGKDFFVVLDEAHHAPAYGCRSFLQSLREEIPNHYLLGLTAIPTYSDKKRSGWLFQIFDQKIIYEANKTKLIAENILAIPKYIEKSTGREYQVDDNLYYQLAKDHKDLPEEIIEELAADSIRNDYIISEYVKNKEIRALGRLKWIALTLTMKCFMAELCQSGTILNKWNVCIASIIKITRNISMPHIT